MKLVLLGTAGYHPNERRHTACLVAPELGVVLDAGSGMFRLPQHIITRRLDILLSHAHLDHVLGLTYLLDILRVRPVDEVVVRGAAEKLASIERHLLSEDLFPVKLPCRYEPLAGPLELPHPDGGPATRVTPFPLAHPGGSIGFRLDRPDCSLAYVTDTTARLDAPYVEVIRGVDLLVHECNFPDAMADMAALTGHSCAGAVAEVARAAGVKRLVLTHLNPLDDSAEFLDLDAARRIFPAIELGQDRQEIEI